MAIENREKELKAIYSDITDNKLVLPNFQRGFVWNREQQAKLLASVLVGLPVGSLLVLEGRAEDFSKRELCFPTKIDINSDCDYVLDGQQRLSTLRSIFFDLFEGVDWQDVYSRMFGPLRTRWFVSINSVDAEEDIFGYKNLDFDSLTKFTDLDVSDYIKCLPIHKTKVNDLHHPAYKYIKPDGSVETRAAFITDHLATEYAKLNLVPLWEVTKERGIHQTVLKKLAQKRVEHLMLEAKSLGHSLDFYESVFSPLSITRDDLEFVINGDTDSDLIEKNLAANWASLAALWHVKVSTVLESMPARKMAIIHLNRDEVHRAVAIFEAINRGGVPLSTYDLVVAKSAREDQAEQNLSSRIIESVSVGLNINRAIFEKFSSSMPGTAEWSPRDMKIIDGNEPSNQFKDWFVNLLSLLVYVKANGEPCAVDHIKREKILSLSPQQVNDYSESAVRAIIRALAFLQLRCGVIYANDISYKLMLVVLAFHLSSDEVWNDKAKVDKLEYWYWLSLLGGNYFSGQNHQCIKDILEVQSFLDGAIPKPSLLTARILNVEDAVNESILLRKDDSGTVEPKSIRLGLLQFVLSKSPSDFVWNTEGQAPKRLLAWEIARGDKEVEVHHIIPLAHSATIGDSTRKIRQDPNCILNTALNLSYISKVANRTISSSNPDEYLELVGDMASAVNYLPAIDLFQEALRTGEYEPVFKARYSLLLNAIKTHLDSLIA